MSVHHVCTVPFEARIGCWTPLVLEFQTVVSCHVLWEPVL